MPATASPAENAGASAFTKALALAGLSALAGVADLAAQGTDLARAREQLTSQPMVFVENLGQWSDAARFCARRGPATAWLVDGGFVATFERPVVIAGAAAFGAPMAGLGPAPEPESFEGVALRFIFVGATARPRGEAPLPGERNYLRGSDASRFVRGARAYAHAVYDAVYPGVDVVARDNGRFLEYDLRLEPWADLDQVVVRVEGADGLRLGADGRLIIDTAIGALFQTTPVSWGQRPDGSRVPVDVAFRVLGPDRYGFRAAGVRPPLPLVVDPGLDWSTYLGAAQDEELYGVAIDDNGYVTVTGWTDSPGFPVSLGVFQKNLRFIDAVVTRFDPRARGAGQLVWSTFFGGGAADYGHSVHVDPVSGATTVVGYTQSNSFPTTPNAFQPRRRGGTDGFVARLDAFGRRLLYSTFVGGGGSTEWEWAIAMDVDQDGVITLGGCTASTSFPTTPNAFQPSYNGGTADVFVLRLDPSRPPANQLLWSTYLGGSGEDYVVSVGNRHERATYLDLFVEPGGIVTIASETTSFDFPTTAGAYQTAMGGFYDAFVTRLDPQQQGVGQLVYSTYLGGIGQDGAAGLEPHPEGGMVLCGYAGIGFPTTPNAFSQTYAGGAFDAFVAWLDPSLQGQQQLRYSTLYGGSGADLLLDLDVERSGIVTVCGVADGAPTTGGAFQRTGPRVGIVGRFALRSSGVQGLHYATYMGNGPPREILVEVVLDDRANATLCGFVENGGHPTTTGAFQGSWNGGRDGVVVQLDLMPAGTERYGESAAVPACGHPIYTGVNQWPKIGSPNFTVLGTGAPPNALGALLLGPRSGPNPPVLGVQTLVDPIWDTASVTANAVGFAEAPLPIPNVANLVGKRLAAQWVFATTTGCPGRGPLATSEGLELTIQ